MADRPPESTGQMPSSFDANPPRNYHHPTHADNDSRDFFNEKPMQKVVRKIKEEPLIPLGIGLTVFAFVNAWRAIRKGDSEKANRMFRARVLAQGFTVVAMVAGGMYYSKDREKTKELRKLKEQRDAEEKRQKWIRELEARDSEEKAMRARLQQKAAAAAEEAKSKVEAVETELGGGGGGGGGGILGRMGLWSQGEKKAADEAEAKAKEEAAEAAREEKKAKNPKSSLGALGEIMASQKKDGSKDEPKE
ncbi:Respiratory supercomplex factor-like protein [Hapsidospora chrysogenum ATCC 11550]|uniref:Respiratory supercomplex factor-like protein n=1 Tax=Hapsidospora chrysogenum (strain ATCC 11550 / CBS 779.69 / DSM 880 / IAM 14645 / JCM 23072 / IMI 49137) TaxID=857340 RepID=A0A086T6A5_HAPC1|nr:Respiratory supercomplex factor-like protein [Hapsidospora chrysogenum ATCC 11550]